VEANEIPAEADQIYESGVVYGVLLYRYMSLRSSGLNDPVFTAPCPKEVPDVIRALLSTMCRASINHRLFETSIASLDRYLLCDSPNEVQAALSMVPDASLQ